MNNSIAIITARGGSKRIPRKNIRDFLGQPILKYSIDAALNARCFDEVMVSTDDMEIQKTALSFGAKVPFLRSEEASGDYATTADAIMEVLLEYRKMGIQFKYCCCIYPAAPFVTPSILKKSFDVIRKTCADSVIPVVRFSYPIQRALKIENGRLSMICPERIDDRSQDLSSAYHDAGQFYWLNTSAFLEKKKFIMDNTVAMELSEFETQDMDNEDDWEMAEIKYKRLKKLT
ncbi:MAG: pseudaminic acid cytidylyltransferase [Candidatus Omnitrophota bacterium]